MITRCMKCGDEITALHDCDIIDLFSCNYDKDYLCPLVDKSRCTFDEVCEDSKRKGQNVKEKVDRGLKYFKPIIGSRDGEIDCYGVAHTFNLTAGVYQAFKKMAFPGERGTKDKIQDLEEAITALQREVEILKGKKLEI